MTTTIVVLFNLKPGVSADDYESWARSTDLPTVRGLNSVSAFEVMKSTGLLMSDDAPPYAYVELLRVDDMTAFGGEVAGERMQKVAAEFQKFADNPLFIVTSDIEA